MKRVGLLVPDRLLSVRGGTDWSRCNEIEVTPEALVEALEADDYHDRVRFPPGSVRVLAIEDATPDEDDPAGSTGDLLKGRADRSSDP
jgi:hypothetical protein